MSDIQKITEVAKRVIIGSINGEQKNKFFLNTLTDVEIDTLSQSHIPEKRMYGKDWPEDAHTMIGYKRMTNIESCLLDVLANNIDGDVIETGVWKGGACIFMKWLINKQASNKRVFVADSFEGLPKPDSHNYPKDAGDIHHTIPELKISIDDVKNNFRQYNLLDENVLFLKGWFKDTLPKIDSNQKFSIIRLDGDMYESTMDSLVNLYPKLVPGGYIIIDDFCLKPCVEATMDYRKTNNITTPILSADFTGVYWKKQ